MRHGSWIRLLDQLQYTHSVTTAQHIFEQVQTLNEAEARQVLEFVIALKRSRERSSATQDVAVFDKYDAVYDGPLDRNGLYHRGK
jgi:hypothetical protein